MGVFVGLLRAVNVGGTGKIAMSDLRGLCEDAGFDDVVTYIQSGNVVFRSKLGVAKAQQKLEQALAAKMGKAVGVHLRTPAELAAIVERNPKTAAFGDVLTTNALASDPENDRARRMLPTLSRVERAARLVKAPLPDIAAMAAVLRDQRGTDDAPKPAGHRGVIDDARSAHAVILDPASLELWVTDPQAAGRMRAFDLRHELRAEGDRPVPPADIASDPSAEPDRVANIAAARAELRDARAALARRDHRRAAEACARARARAPELPEAIELDAVISQARGDDARARKLFQQWLDGGADDPVAEERAKALLNR